jgi:ribosome-associated protein
MSTDDVVRVTAALSIPRREFRARATRAGGPGGQHVNTSSTRIELLWDFERSRALTDEQRARLREKLAARLDADGVLRVVSAETRSQGENRLRAEARLAALVRAALKVPRTRRTTKVPRGAIESRLDTKRRTAGKKADRRWKNEDD